MVGCGQKLENKKKIKDYPIYNDTTLYFMLRTRGGGCANTAFENSGLQIKLKEELKENSLVN